MDLLIVTGFLGAGKTTFLQHALAAGRLGRAALLVNEFGSADIDGTLLETAGAGAPLVRLPNGCVCCKVQADFIGAVQAIAARVRAGELALDRFVLETSGLADPAPLLAQVLAARALRETIERAYAITVVDGVAGAAVLERHVEARHQVACADLVLLSKADQLPAVELQAWQQRLEARNPHAPVVAARHGVPEDALWMQRLEQPAEQHRQQPREHDHGHGHGHDHHEHAHAHAPDHDHPHDHAHTDDPAAHHSQGIESFRLRCGALPSRDHLQGWSSALVLLHADQLLRLKGFITLIGEAQPLLLQGALDGLRWTPWPHRDKGHAGADGGTEIIAIARGMDEERHRAGLRRALLDIHPQAQLDP